MVSVAEQTENTPDQRAAEEAAVRRQWGGAARHLPLLRRADQWVVAVVVALSLVAVAGYWAMRGGPGGELIEIETDEEVDEGLRRTARYSVDINSADWPEFEPLPGVGERLARRIVESRATEGPFRSVEDLQRVRGMGEKTIERLRPYLRVDSPRR